MYIVMTFRCKTDDISLPTWIEEVQLVIHLQ